MSLSDPSAPPGNPDVRYQQDATAFVGIMGDMASDLILDYSVESIQRLDQFITENFAPPATNVGESLIHGIGCYVGEVIIRHLGGRWDQDGKPQIHGIGCVEAILPLEKAARRFQVGPQESLNWYYHTLAKHAYEGRQTPAGIQQQSHSQDNGGGLMGMFKGLFGK